MARSGSYTSGRRTKPAKKLFDWKVAGIYRWKAHLRLTTLPADFSLS